MAIKWVYLCTGTAGFFLFCNLPLLFNIGSWDLDLDLRWASPWIQAILALVILIVIIVVVFLLVAAAAIIPVHVGWVLIAVVLIWNNERRTWSNIRTDEIFSVGEPGQPEPTARYTDEDDDNDDPDASSSNVNVDERAPLYTNLQFSGITDIRLLELEPHGAEAEAGHGDGAGNGDGSPGPRLRFLLKVWNMNDARRKYSALSYCWGDGTDSQPIHVNGTTVNVRFNLHRGLRQLVSEGHKYIWVDDLCINQADKGEQAKQIVRVAPIFQEAKIVIAWTWTTKSHPSEDATALAVEAVEPQADDSDAPEPSMEEVKRTQYWHRMWPVQEFAVAKNIRIHVGTSNRRKISADELQIKLQKAVSSSNDHNAFPFLRNAIDIRKKYQSLQDSSLLDLLLRTTANKSDWRLDRVYGLISMARDGRDFLTEPSYDMGEKEIGEEKLSRQMTSFYIERRSSHLDIILLGPCFAQSSLSVSRSLRWPSWCPNYCRFDKLPDDRRLFGYVRDLLDRGRNRQPPPNIDSDAKNRPLFWATNESVCRARVDESLTLHTEAKFLGTVASLGWIPSDGPGSNFPKTESIAKPTISGIEVAAGLWDLLQTLSQRDSWRAYLDRSTPAAADPILDHDYRTCTAAFRNFMLLVFRHKTLPDLENGPYGWYAQWLCRNQQFTFGSRTLHEHAADVAPWRLLGRKKNLWRWSEHMKDMLDATTRHSELWSWKRMHQPLWTVAQQGMRLTELAMQDRSVLGLAHPSSREGDAVWLLAGCSVPVVLRKLSNLDNGPDRYKVIGDAIIPGAMFGDAWADLLWGNIGII
ncbi:uncharacterized protein LTR77_002238 [Saxophila tyrrhenica]|uniref:Heterokaryon incompatibility domain-containing protein n=1 Tax=Saxophila tyrrhenica TaxID=1690608 RepID=A0AAV9PHY4_9PEZI|nr:hypothetical protein LTR77_002238 [Saxophila tyrrhenica]